MPNVNLNTMVNATEMTIYSLVVAVGTSVVDKGGGSLSGKDASRCFPVTSASVNASLGSASGGGSFCTCSVIPHNLNKTENINDMSSTDDGEKFLKIAKPGTRASVAMSYSEDGGKTIEIDVLYVGLIGGVSVSEHSGLGSYRLQYSLEIVHPAVFISSRFIPNPYRFDVWCGNVLNAVHPASKKVLDKAKINAAKSGGDGIDVCRLVLDGLDAAASVNRNPGRLNDLTVSDIVDLSNRPIVAVSGISRVFDNTKGGLPLRDHIVTSAYNSTISQSPWAVFVNMIGGFGISTAPVLWFDIKDTDPANKNTKFSNVDTYMPFLSFKAKPDTLTLTLNQILGYNLDPPSTDENDSAAIAINYASNTTSSTNKNASGDLFVIINAGHTPDGKPFYICGTLDNKNKNKSKKDPAFIDVKLNKITARGAYSLTVDKVFQTVDLPRWCRHPCLFDLKNDDYVKAKKAFAEFWGNVAYASKCNSFGSMAITLPLYEALQLRGELGTVLKVIISADTVLVGGVSKLSFSIENSGDGFKTTGRLDLIAVRSEQDDDVLGLPLSTVAAMYKQAK